MPRERARTGPGGRHQIPRRTGGGRRVMRIVTVGPLAAIPFALTALMAGPVRAGERYYALIFGSQSSPKRLKYTHTWATFVRVVGEGNDPNGYQIYQHSIS